MKQHDMGEMSQRVLQQTVMSKIGLSTDNVMVQYMLSFVAITFLGLITTNLSTWFEALRDWISAKFFPDPDEPGIKFVVSKRKDRPTFRGATTAVLAWMEQIELSVEKYENNDKDNKKYRNSLLKLRGLTTGGNDDHWLPDQTKIFDIDTNIWVKFTSNTIKDKESDIYSVEEYNISIHTKTELGLSYLLKYHNNVLTKYKKKLTSKYANKSHVFKYESYNEDTKEIIWTTNEFSSTRKLKHIWFSSKNVFINAYKNYLYNSDDYIERGDPYTFSVLLHGPPGCGKTSLLKALINYDREIRNITTHLFVISFGKISKVEIFEKIMLDKLVNKTEIDMDRRIYVFEDFDANDQANVFNIRDGLKQNISKKYGYNKPKTSVSITKTDRKDGKKKGNDNKEEKKEDHNSKEKLLALLLKSDGDDDKWSYSSLNLTDILNTLDGICERTGQRCIWTTNKSPPQKYFDPAFLRPGRMDMIIQLGRCSYSGIDYLIRSYFKDFDIDMDDVVDQKYDTCNDNLKDFNHISYNINGDNIKIDCSGIDENRFTPAQIKQICKESTSLKHAVNTMKEICNAKKKVNKLSKINEDIQDNKEEKINLLKAKSSPIYLMRNELAELRMMDIKRLPSGHWIEPPVKNVDQTQYVDTKALNDNNDNTNDDNDKLFVQSKTSD